jgi:hypothetical protein
MRTPLVAVGLALAACAPPPEVAPARAPAPAPPAAGAEEGALALTGDVRAARRLPYYANATPALASDAQGRALLAGRVYGSVDFGSGPLGTDGDWMLFLVKLDEGGQVVMQKSFRVGYGAQLTAVAVDDAGFAVVAGFTNEPIDLGTGPVGVAGSRSLFFAKLDPEGRALWAHGFRDAGYSYAAPNAAALDRAGNAVFAGSHYGPLDFGGGPVKHSGGTDAFVASFDHLGRHRYSMSFGSTGTETATGLAIDPSGQPVVVGTFTSSVDFGAASLRGETRGDIFVLRLDPSGRPIQAKKVGGEGKDEPRGVAVDARGNVALTAALQRGTEWIFDAVVVVLDAQGNEAWRRAFTETTSYGDVRPLAFDHLGNVIVAGPRWEERGGASSTYVVKLRADGEPLYTRKLDGQLTVLSIATASATGEALVLGVGVGPLRYGKRELPAAGGQTLLLRLAP